MLCVINMEVDLLPLDDDKPRLTGKDPMLTTPDGPNAIFE